MKRLILVLLILLVTDYGYAQGFTDKVYKTINVPEGTACYRLVNGTHQFGCHGDGKNSDGMLVLVETVEDLSELKDCYRLKYPFYKRKYWILMDVGLLRREVIHLIRESNCTSGLVLFDNTKRTLTDDIAGSHDASCPNEATNFYKSKCSPVNSKGYLTTEGLRNIDWKLQMVYVNNQTHIDTLRKCYTLFNKPNSGYPFCGMSFKLSNNAAGNSEICYRRGLSESKLFQLNIDSNVPLPFCTPLVGHNIYAFPVPLNNTQQFLEEPRYMVISTRMDSFGVIPEVSPGEISVITSLISTIVAARSIGMNIKEWKEASIKSNKFIMFAAFNGESFDYIGSSSAVHRMRKNEFPLPALNLTQLRSLNLSVIDYVVELQHIGTSEDKNFYVHMDKKRKIKDQDRILDKVKETFGADGYTLKMSKEANIPSSSWHSFAKFDDKIQSVLISPFDEFYNYRRVNSIIDRNVWNEHDKMKAIGEIVSASKAILSAAAEYTGLSKNYTNIVDENLAKTLFECLVQADNWFECEFMEKLNGDRFEAVTDSYSMNRKSTYISVSSNNPYRHLVHWLFVFAIGSDRETLNVKNKNSCMHLSEHQAIYSYDWQPNPYTGNFSCLRSSIQYIQEQSPAFDIEGYDLSRNSTYSTWTESIYSIESVRLFLMEDESVDLYMLFIAISVLIFSLISIGRCSESTFIIDEGEQLAEIGEPL